MTSHTITAPALRCDDTLGFLAAVGIVTLSYLGEIPEVRLGWSNGLSGHAEFRSDALTNREQLSEALAECFIRTRNRDAVLAGGPVDLPLVKPGVGKDPNRMPPNKAASLHQRAVEAWLNDDASVVQWTVGLFGQTALASNGETVRTTPFYGPATGTMALRTSMYEKTYEAVELVGGPGDALTGWIRTPANSDYMGANIDPRAIRDSGATTDGKTANQGAPSPTWLASVTPALLPVAERDRVWGALGWQAVRTDRSLTRRSLVWPVWREPLNGTAVRALLSHPVLELTERDGRLGFAAPRAVKSLQGLGVRIVYASSRSTSQQGDGPMGAAVRIWSQ